VTTLHHLALGTPNVGRLAQFYSEVLGLPELKRHTHDNGSLRSVWLDLGGAILMIEETAEPPRVVNGIGAGLFLIAIAVSVEERAEFEHRLERAGCVIESRTEWTSYARDWDGNRIGVSAYPVPGA
jgi:catechol 2,3-dioxygenase-like lactoylglutathione lyase family enzyme